MIEIKVDARDGRYRDSAKGDMTMQVLLVEDDPRIRSDVTAALEAHHYIVDVERDGEQAWFKGDTEDYSAVILDLGLPQMDGLSVLKRWRAGGRDFPVLVLTARGTWSERVEGIDAGADDYLPKPFRHGGAAGAAAGDPAQATGRARKRDRARWRHRRRYASDAGHAQGHPVLACRHRNFG